MSLGVASFFLLRTSGVTTPRSIASFTACPSRSKPSDFGCARQSTFHLRFAMVGAPLGTPLMGVRPLDGTGPFRAAPTQPPPRSGSGGRSGGIPLTRPGRGSVGLGRSSSGALALDGAAVSPWSRQQGSGVGRAHAASQTRHDVGEVLNGVDPRDAAGAEDRVRNRRAPPTGV